MAETMYGTQEGDSQNVMSERVQSLASSVYQEFERMLKRYDEDVVKELMPLVVGILENLDQSYQEKQETDVELELLRDDNEQLLTQYEREKQLRKGSEQKALELEDATEEERKELQAQTESLESVVRMLELKGKNAQDHISRLEDKEGEMKKEYSKLHERYTDLFKTHMDYMERTKLVMGGDRICEMGASPRNRGGLHMPHLKSINPGIYHSGDTPLSPDAGFPGDSATSPASHGSNVSLKNELQNLDSSVETAEKEQNTDNVVVSTQSTGTKNTKTDDSKAAAATTTTTMTKETAKEQNSNDSKTVTESTPVKEAGDKTEVSSKVEIKVEAAEGEVGQQTIQQKKQQAELEISHIAGDVSYEEDFGDMMNSPDVEEGSSGFGPTKSTPIDAASKRTPGNTSSIFDEFSEHSMEAIGDVDDGVDITGSVVNPGDFASTDDGLDSLALDPNDNDKESNGMSKEVENLILENTELLATKNALNIVKDDLISKVDELTRIKDFDLCDEYVPYVFRSEQEILKEEINSLQGMREKLKNRVSELEGDLKKVKEELEKVKEKQAGGQEGEEGTDGEIPMAQRKRFTRVEMARVLMERNQYKERLMELQEAVRWTEMIRASKEHPDVVPASKKKGSIWNLFSGSTDIVETVNEQISTLSWPTSFSNLFSTDKPKMRRAIATPTLHYSSPTSVRPVGDPNKKHRDNYNLGEKSRAYDFLQDDLLTEKSRKEREKERREQYKQVRAHVKKDDGRMQAYGWSLPSKLTPSNSNRDLGGKGAVVGRSSKVPVPVPVYCRPLVEKDDTLKIWCAAGVTMTGGKTKDGGSIVGGSVFYSDTTTTTTVEVHRTATGDGQQNTDVEKLNKELEDGSQELSISNRSSPNSLEESCSSDHNSDQEHEKDLKVKEDEQDKMTSVVWICTTTHNHSQVSVIDANNPGEVLENFRVSTSHVLCIASVPGALETDFACDDDDIICTGGTMTDTPDSEEAPQCTDKDGVQPQDESAKTEEKVEGEVGTGETAGSGETASTVETADQGIGGITFVQCITGSTSPVQEDNEKKEEPKENAEATTNRVQPTVGNNNNNHIDDDNKPYEFDDHYFEDPLGVSPEVETLTVIKAKGSPVKSGDITPTQPDAGKLPMDNKQALITDGVSDVGLNIMSEEMTKLSSLLPTMWIGTQSGSLYVHSVVSNWKRCLHSVKLKDSVLSIVHVKGRVFVALADGSVAVFRRNKESQWDLGNYHLIDLGKPHHSVRCLCVVANKHVWCGHKNKVHIIDPKTLKLEKSFDAHPRKESQVRQLAWTGDGVWVSIRLDSTLRLYHAYTHQHLQDVDIEPYVSKMLGTGKLGFSFVRITSLLISCSRLWIGTGNGVIISVPLSDTNKQAVTMATAGRPGGVVRVYNDVARDSVTPGSFIPYCSMAQAQLSFHGHRDAVKFFAAVPGIPSNGVSGVAASKKDEKSDMEKDSSSNYKNMLVMSGGEGYIDFRLGDPEDESDNTEEDSGTSGTEGSGPSEKKTISISKGDRSHLIVWQVFQPK